MSGYSADKALPQDDDEIPDDDQVVAVLDPPEPWWTDNPDG